MNAIHQDTRLLLERLQDETGHSRANLDGNQFFTRSFAEELYGETGTWLVARARVDMSIDDDVIHSISPPSL